MDDNHPTPPPNEQDRLLMTQTMVSGLALAEAAGVSKKAAMAVLWHATITALLEFASPDLAIAYLEDRAAATKGHGINGDSPLIVLDEVERRALARDVPVGAEMVYEYVAPLIDAIDDQNRDGISAFTLAAFGMLKDWWGPVHLRRNIISQVKALRAAKYAPIMPAEPTIPNVVRPMTDSPMGQRNRSAKDATIVAFVGERSSRWVVTSEATERNMDRKDHRTISGTSNTKPEAIVSLADAMLTVLHSLGSPHPEDRIKIVTDLPRDPLLGGGLPRSLSERLAVAIADRRVEWTDGEETIKLMERTKKALDDKP